MSYRLDDAGERVFHSGTLPDPAVIGLTVMGWFRVRVDRDDFSTYWRTSSGGGTIHTVATNIGGVTVNVFTTAGSLDNTYANVIDEWVHIAVTDSGGTVTQYVTSDGGSVVSQSGSVGTGSPDQICLGGRDSGTATEWLNGAIANVRVFAAVLTQTQVETERDSATAVLTAWADWPLPTGTDLADISGNGRNLTAVAVGATAEEDPPIGGTDLTLTDTPAGTRIGATAGQLLTGLLTTDAPAALRSGGPAGALLIGAALADQPTGVRAAGPDGLLLIDVIHSDQPDAARAGGTGETLTAALLHSDLPEAARLAGPAGTLLLGGDTTLGDSPWGARASGVTGALLVSSSYTWPPRAGSLTVRRPAIGTVRIQRVATGTMTVT